MFRDSVELHQIFAKEQAYVIISAFKCMKMYDNMEHAGTIIVIIEAQDDNSCNLFFQVFPFVRNREPKIRYMEKKKRTSCPKINNET